MSFRSPISMRHEDANTDRQMRNLDERVREVVDVPVLRGRLILDIELADATEVAVAHGLGRAATAMVSPPRDVSTSGTIQEVRSSTYDRKVYVVLKATGMGATVTVDMWAF